ncbi:MAG: hypothetical protein ABIO48_12380, partial [Pedococcus sp.]
MTRQGYTQATIRNMLKDLSQVGVWLSDQGLEAEQLDEDQMAAFLSARRMAGRRRIPGARAMVPLLRYLRQIGVAGQERPSLTPLGELLNQYQSWMVQERGLA